MVVLSVSILTASGSKALVSRQFVEMSRMRVEGLLAAFPKLVSHSKHHTFVETDTVRYIYQPLDNQMYLLLITTKSSNIVEDLGTLRLLAKVVPDVAGGLHESSINEHAFELIFAFDEVLTTGGYKEDVTISAVQTNLLMDSHEEKMQLLIEEKQKETARKAMEEKANEIKKRQMENLKANIMNGMGAESCVRSTASMEGFGGGGHGPSPGYEIFGSNSNVGAYSSYSDPLKTREPEREDKPHVSAKTTFSLGKGSGNKKKDNIMVLMAAEDNFPLCRTNTPTINGLTPDVDVLAAPHTPLTILLEEKLSVAMNREGGVESCEVKGTLFLTSNTETGSMASVSVNKTAIISKCTKNWAFATHPKVSKPDYERNGTLVLKGGKELPLNRPVGVLKWSYHGNDACPLTINCWPEDENNGSINVNIEYGLTRPDMAMHDINILVPVGTTDNPIIESIDGQYTFDASSGVICWYHDVINSKNSSGSLEFSIAGSNIDAFFPVKIGFKSEHLMCPIEVTEVTSSCNDSPIPNKLIRSVVPEDYQVA